MSQTSWRPKIRISSAKIRTVFRGLREEPNKAQAILQIVRLLLAVAKRNARHVRLRVALVGFQRTFKADTPAANLQDVFVELLATSRKTSLNLRPIPGRVVLIGGNLSPGGAERQFCYTGLGLQHKGLESLHVLCENLSPDHPNKYDFYKGKLEEAGLQPREIRSLVTPKKIRQLPLEAREALSKVPTSLAADILNAYFELIDIRPAIVHAWLDWCNVRIGIAAILAGVPRVVLSGRSLSPANFSLYQDYMDPAYKAMTQFPSVQLLNNSQAGANDYARWLDIEPDQIRVIHNGVDICVSKSQPSRVLEMRERFGLPEETFIVGGVFRLQYEKRPLLWLKVAALVAERVPNARFVIFGQGPMKQEVLSLAANLGIADRLVLPGVTNDVMSAMSMMDIFLLTSQAEGLPNVLLEAQLAGTPVVATDVGGVRECLSDNETGYVVDDDEGIMLASRIIELHSNKSKLMRAGELGRRFVSTNFSIEKMISETWSTYEIDALA